MAEHASETRQSNMRVPTLENEALRRAEVVEAIERASHMDDPRNPPNASGQVAIAKAILFLADTIGGSR